jgi:hypothetical protein
MSDEDILMRADSILSPKRVQDDLDRTLLERKLQRFEKKLQKYDPHHPEYDLIRKKIHSYKQRLASPNTIKATVHLQDALYAPGDKEECNNIAVSRQTLTAMTPLSGARGGEDDGGDDGGISTISNSATTSTTMRSRGRAPATVIPPSPNSNQDSFATLSTMCSPTEFNESYVSMDPCSPYALVVDGSTTSKHSLVPPPPLEQAVTLPHRRQHVDKTEPKNLYCKVFQQHQCSSNNSNVTDQETILVHIGFVVLDAVSQPTFAHARQVIVEELVPDMLTETMEWKFVVPTLGRVSQKQEDLFGPLSTMMVINPSNNENHQNHDTSHALGTLQHPISLVIVETDRREVSKNYNRNPFKQRAESDSTIVTSTIRSTVAMHEQEEESNNITAATEEHQSSYKKQASGQQSEQAKEKIQEREKRESEHSTGEPHQTTAEAHSRVIEGTVEEDSTSEDAPPMKRSWKIHWDPEVIPSMTEENDQCHQHDNNTQRASVSLQSVDRTYLIGYNRPEVFDPPPRSLHSRNSSLRTSSYSPRKPRASQVTEAVHQFKTFQTDRNESLLSTAESIDSTKPFVAVIAPKQLSCSDGKTHDNITLPGYSDSVEVMPHVESTPAPTINSKLQGFTRHFWRPKQRVTNPIDQEQGVKNRSFPVEGEQAMFDDDPVSTVDVESDIESLPDKEEEVAEFASIPEATVEQKEEDAVYVNPEVIEDDIHLEEARTCEVVAEEDFMEIIPVERKITKRLVMLVTLYSGNREIMPKQKRAIAMLATCQIPPKIVDGSDPSNKQIRNDLFEIAEMRGVYPLFFIEERDEGNYQASPNVTFVGTFETIEKLKDEETLGDILKA